MIKALIVVTVMLIASTGYHYYNKTRDVQEPRLLLHGPEQHLSKAKWL